MNSNTLRVSRYIKEARKNKKKNDGNLANNYPPYDKITRGDVIAGRLGKDEMGGKRKVSEALIGDQDKIDVAPPYGKLTSQDFKKLRKSKKKSVKEGYSNWREDLSEIAEIAEIGKEKNTEKIVEKKVKNNIEINPRINTGDRLSGMSANECVEKMGGTLLEMEEYSQECILEELNPLELLAVTDELLEEVVYEFFIEALEEGYELEEIEESILESIENSFQLLTEEDNPRKRGVLSRLKRFAKGAAKKIARAPGYLAGLGARALVRGAQELGKGAVRGYKGAEKDDDDEEEAPSRSRVTSSERDSEPSRSRVTSSSDRGRTRARSSESRVTNSEPSRSRVTSSERPSATSNQSRRRVQVTQSASDTSSTSNQPRVRQTAKDGILKGLRKTLSGYAHYIGHKLSTEHGKPHPAHSKSGERASRTYSGVGGGKRIEVAGEKKKEPEIKKVSVSDETPSKAHSKSGVRTPRPYSSSSEKPSESNFSKEQEARTQSFRTRVPSSPSRAAHKETSRGVRVSLKQAAQRKKEAAAAEASSTSPKVTTTTVPASSVTSSKKGKGKGGKSASTSTPSRRGNAPASSTPPSSSTSSRSRRRGKPEIDNPELNESGSDLDKLLKSMKSESYQLTEKSESEQQQKLFGLALSVKRGTTPRSEVSSAVLKIVDTLTEKQIRDFAKTKHEGIPKKVTKEEAIREELTIRMLAKIIEQSDSMPEITPTNRKPQQNVSATAKVLTAIAANKASDAKTASALKQAALKGVNVAALSG